ncbi:hypothetical protein B0T25DRAFT_564898 [Lasiosphaeria hispida]|uniref:Zn(2)-C6 fungal-type domain-containing protein n=1 Tax=Lasiosphaeria hispida TaxID=260671 RepID=A0AAJ0HR48_9PEZI|nr:hypothetical protein B0T25DRAFT_564898 [Lasiosphaeria hispida]
MAATSSSNGPAAIAAGPSSGSVSPRTSSEPKTISFELLFQDLPQYRARLPLRVSIYPHDTTESIVTTVKNFYGLYSGPAVSKGVSFEDDQGRTMIARYENFRDNMTVSVRVIEEPAQPDFSPHGFHSPSGGQGLYSAETFPMQPPQQSVSHISRPASRTSRIRSPSPNSGRGRRSASAGTASKKGRSRSSKSRVLGSQANGESHNDSVNGYSSGDGAPGSASGKTKEQLGNTEISVENIVEGGRRKRAKFESSELPLFAPPQMPAATSNSSVSPARRIEQHRNSLPFVQHGQNPFSNPRPLQSPQSYTNGYVHPGMYATPGLDGRRTRGSFGYPQSGGMGPAVGMMPTPDPTVGSCMSEEDKDVAIQLMRLGEMSNVSHGRTSASTLDDTFSGRADAASSTGATSDDSESDEEMPAARRQKLDAIGSHKKLFNTTENHFVGPQESVEASGDDADYEDGAEEGSMAAPRLKSSKPKAGSVNGSKPRPQSSGKLKSSKPSKPKVKKATSSTGPLSPSSLPTSRKPSVASNVAFPLLPGEDDQPDLSTKPRCQRCRKSKKGCDRQRPCGRCRDAGIPAELCISEDEGNGRKGRYGRHMGVPLVKKDEVPISTALLPAAPISMAAPPSEALTAVSSALDKNKKRKR